MKIWLVLGLVLLVGIAWLSPLRGFLTNAPVPAEVEEPAPEELDAEDVSRTPDPVASRTAVPEPLPSRTAQPRTAEPRTADPAQEPDAGLDPPITLSDDEPSPTLAVPGLSPEAPPATAEAPEPAPGSTPAETPTVETQPSPRRDPLPAEPLDPAEALAAISPDLAVPAAPPVRRPRPVEGGTEAEAAAPAVPAEDAAPTASATPPADPAAAPDPAPEEPATRRIVGDRVNLREGPGTDTASLATLSRDDTVEILESRTDWVRVRTEGGNEGWIAEQFLAD